MSAYRDRLLSVGFIRGGRARSRVQEHRAEDGTRVKAVTDELDNTVTEHSRPGTGVSFRQDVQIRPQVVTMEDGL